MHKVVLLRHGESEWKLARALGVRTRMLVE